MKFDPKARDQFEIAIICALPLEADAVLALFDEFYNITDWQPLETPNSYTVGRIGSHHVVLAHMSEIGKVGAASVASRLSTSFGRIKLALVVGICGGVPFTAEMEEIILGDVIISHSIVEYDSGKQYPDGFREKSGLKDTLPRPSQDIGSFLSKLKTKKMKEFRYLGTSYDVLFEASYRHKHHRPDISLQCSCKANADPVCDEALISDCSTLGCAGQLIERDRLRAEHPPPLIYIGNLASADTVMKSGEHRDKLAEINGIIGFEMEAAGVWDNMPCVIIKGVCDYADSHKSKLWQRYAALTAACCTKAFLESYQPTGLGSTSLNPQVLTYLRNYYTMANRLHIQRISGELLPMDQCYINLSVVESLHSSKAKSVKQSSIFSFYQRMGIVTFDTDDTDKQVSLPTLFESRRSSDGTDFVPKRVLLRGRAGVGKTTLCKKIVSEYLHHGMWHQLFDLILWVPLRRLKGRSAEKSTIVGLFHDLYFSKFEEGRSLARDLWKIVDGPARTLLILDGLDEVSQEWGSETPMNDVLLTLLNQPQVIITSRPYGINLGSLAPLDLELETVGFNSSQVEAYIRNIEKRCHTKVDEMLSFIPKYPLIQDLARIPIQLDAMCYSWDNSFMSDTPKTMTTLYQAITLKLWQKDILRLGKSQLSEHEIQILSPKEIQAFVSDEMAFLETIAFIGLYNDMVEFNATDRHRIRDTLALPDVPDPALKKIFFLHTSDTTVMDQDRSYHFLHLTFQEFFAARYIMRHWVDRQQMLCLELKQQRPPKVIHIKPEDFLHREKLNLRYNILWRFVAGLLQRVDGLDPPEPLTHFFQELHAEPRDLLGPAHQRMLMHFISEVVPNPEDICDLRVKIEGHVQRWLLFECDFHDRISLVEERECPEHLLKSLLQGGSSKVKICTLEDSFARYNLEEGLKKQNLPPGDIRTLVQLLDRIHPQQNIQRILSKQKLPQAILETWSSFLRRMTLRNTMRF